ncbi:MULTISPECIES: TfoX/Sxy family protein [unclassified Pseudarthrobacter]|uniref:TfoX/Sxy family protein n=1 Tax=unclassified Pseudarthrobacter TaxID=2647000 RepID=UPI0036430A3E
MEMPKASEQDKERFRRVVPDHPDVVVKPMFGNLGAFINGNMFAGLFGSTIGVKLSDADRGILESSERTVPFGPAERPMGGYTGLPEVWNEEGDGDDTRARAWAEKALGYIATLPPKQPKEPKATKEPKARAPRSGTPRAAAK